MIQEQLALNARPMYTHSSKDWQESYVFADGVDKTLKVLGWTRPDAIVFRWIDSNNNVMRLSRQEITTKQIARKLVAST